MHKNPVLHMTRIACLRLALASVLPLTLGLATSVLAQTTAPAPLPADVPSAAIGSPERPLNEAALRQRNALQPTATEHEGIEVFKVDASGQPIRPASSQPKSDNPTGGASSSPSGGSNVVIQLNLDDLPGFKDKKADEAAPADDPAWKAAFQPPAQTTNGIAIPEKYQQAPAEPAQPATDYSNGVPIRDPDAPADQPAGQELKIDSQDLYQQMNRAAQASPAPARPEPTARPASGDGPRFSFESNTYDFGDIKEGDVVRYEIKFRNTGKAPLKLSSVKASCGCTAADWPRDEIKPGEQGTIHVKFNSAGRLGPQSKSITVTTNEAEGKPYQFHLKGEVFKGTPPAR